MTNSTITQVNLLIWHCFTKWWLHLVRLWCYSGLQ